MYVETNDVNSPNPGTLHFTLPERRNIFWQECRRYLLVVEVRDRSAEAFRATVHRRKRNIFWQECRRYELVWNGGGG